MSEIIPPGPIVYERLSTEGRTVHIRTRGEGFVGMIQTTKESGWMPPGEWDLWSGYLMGGPFGPCWEEFTNKADAIAWAVLMADKWIPYSDKVCK